MISIGAYVKGSDPKVDHAKKIIPKIISFLRQDISAKSSYETAIQELEAILKI